MQVVLEISVRLSALLMLFDSHGDDGADGTGGGGGASIERSDK